MVSGAGVGAGAIFLVVSICVVSLVPVSFFDLQPLAIPLIIATAIARLKICFFIGNRIRYLIFVQFISFYNSTLQNIVSKVLPLPVIQGIKGNFSDI